jgi:hypothetical protein
MAHGNTASKVLLEIVVAESIKWMEEKMKPI